MEKTNRNWLTSVLGRDENEVAQMSESEVKLMGAIMGKNDAETLFKFRLPRGQHQQITQYIKKNHDKGLEDAGFWQVNIGNHHMLTLHGADGEINDSYKGNESIGYMTNNNGYLIYDPIKQTLQVDAHNMYGSKSLLRDEAYARTFSKIIDIILKHYNK